jgi:hypothetical protein
MGTATGRSYGGPCLVAVGQVAPKAVVLEAAELEDATRVLQELAQSDGVLGRGLVVVRGLAVVGDEVDDAHRVAPVDHDLARAAFVTDQELAGAERRDAHGDQRLRAQVALAEEHEDDPETILEIGQVARPVFGREVPRQSDGVLQSWRRHVVLLHTDRHYCQNL